jgi:hypothetical protein
MEWSMTHRTSAIAMDACLTAEDYFPDVLIAR